jgi:putative peptidoglycan lipid II flippase
VPTPIVQALFERGAFTPADTPATAYALAIFALGLPSFVLIKVFSPAYFAREDTATPMRYATLSLTLNTLGSIALFFAFRAWGLMPHLGIAVATTLGGWLNAALLHATLARTGQFASDARLRRALPRIVLASLAMSALLWMVAVLLAPSFARTGATLERALALLTLIGTGILAYGAAVLGLGAVQIRQLLPLLRRASPAADN